MIVHGRKTHEASTCSLKIAETAYRDNVASWDFPF